MRRTLSAMMLMMLATSAMAADAKPMAPGPDQAIMKTAEGFFGAWNKHDVKTMVTFWADDASLINPMGRMAHGKAEIEALLNDEQTTVFKSSTAAVLALKVTRPLGPKIVFADGEMTVDGAVGPDGAAMPQMKMHLAITLERNGARWMFLDARPYMFAQPPAGAAKGN